MCGNCPAIVSVMATGDAQGSLILRNFSRRFPRQPELRTMPWRYKILITYFLYTCRDDLTENVVKTIAQECKKSTSGRRVSLKSAFA